MQNFTLKRHNWALGMRLLWRDYKRGDLRIIALATILAVTCLTAISVCSQVIKTVVNSQPSEMLGGDRVLSQALPIDAKMHKLAMEHNLKQSQSVVFFSMLATANAMELAEVRAVDSNYPLKGQIILAANNAKLEQNVAHGPMPGEVWLDANLAQLLKADIGTVIKIGYQEFTVTNLITLEPGGSTYFFALAPRAMIALADAAKTQVVQAGSRVKYELMLSGAKGDLQAFDQALAQTLLPTQKYVKAEIAQGNVNNYLTDGLNLVRLAGMVNIILAGLAIALAANSFAARHQQQVGVLRFLGATKSQIMHTYVASTIILGLVLGIIGVFIGDGIAALVLKRLLGSKAASMHSVISMALVSGVILAWSILLGYALPPLLRLRDVPAMQVFRNLDHANVMEKVSAKNNSWYLIGTLVFVAILLWQIDSYELLAMFILGTIGVIVALLIIVRLAFSWLIKLKSRLPVLIKLGISNLTHNYRDSVVQITVFTLLIAVVVVLYLTKIELLQNWQVQLPAETPNKFVINILPAEVNKFTQYLQQQNVKVEAMYPLISGKLIAINGELVSSTNKRRGFDRALNLTWSSTLPADNTIIAGQWFGAVNPPIADGISIEQGAAERLGVGLGDKLTFQIGSVTITASITNMRTVHWDSFKPNFFIIYPPGVFENLPHTFMTSFYISKDQSQFLLEMRQQFPSISVIDTNSIIKRMQSVLDLIIKVVEMLWLFTLISGLVLLFAVILVKNQIRMQDMRILQLLGVKKNQLSLISGTEFGIIGLISAVVGSIFATVGVIWTTAAIFTVSYQWNFAALLGIMLTAMVLIIIFGIGSIRLLGKK